MMKKISSLIIIILMIATSLVQAKVPKWATDGQHKKYPQSKYFTGVGIAGDMAAANDLARTEVGSQIRVSIESELVNVENEFREGDKSLVTSEASSTTKSVVNETLAGIEIVETVKDKDKVYVFAVLNKAKYLATLEVEMAEVLAKTEQLVSGARTLAESGKVFPAIENYLDARDVIPEFYVKSSLYTALTGKRYPNYEQFSGPAIMAEIRQKLAAIELVIVSGNNQKAFSGQTLSQPIVVKALFQEDGSSIGLDNFPLTLRMPSGDVIDRKETRADGTAEFHIKATATDNIGESGEVRVSLNLANLPNELKDALSKSTQTIYYSVEKANLKFSVKVDDKSGARFPDIEEKISDLITQNGYTVISDAPFIIEGHVAITKDKTIDSPAGEQFYIETAVQLQLKDKTGNILASVKGKGKGLDMNSRDAAVKTANQKIRFSKSDFASFLQKAM